MLALLCALTGAGFARAPERLLVRDVPSLALPTNRDVLVGRDIAPGAGIFEYAGGETLRDYCWPVVAVGPTGTIHLVMLDSARQTLYASRIVTWPNAAPPVRLGRPGYPTHNFAASRVSDRLCVTWVRFDTCPMTAWFRTSDDGGATWADSVQLPAPPAFAGDTITSFHVSSLYPYYPGDSDDLHIVACLHPVVAGEPLVMPAETWHWCGENNPNWNRIHRAACAPGNLGAPVGFNALYAGRPSLVSDDDRARLYALWEEFDSLDVEPGPPPRLRADIQLCGSSNNGASWTPPSRISSVAAASFRFPSLTLSGDNCQLYIRAISDQVAGFATLGEGVLLYNPILLLEIDLQHGSPYACDTIGGTTLDLQALGPALRTIESSTDFGVHAVWSRSAELTNPELPDLNSRYNFFDLAANAWSWIDPDYMQSGVNTFALRAGGASVAADPLTGCAVIAGAGLVPFPPAGQAEPRPRHGRTVSTPALAALLADGCAIRDALGRKITTPTAPGGVYFISRPGEPLGKLILIR